MCGFVAGNYRSSADLARLNKAVDLIHHRGPDGRKTWVSEDRKWVLGHTRLSIIGLENGTQPMSNVGGKVHLVVNGEFYGYTGVRDELKAEGAKFATESDSEIALHLYLRDGMAMMPHLRGEFAGVIVDERNNAMIGIRDRFGIKPLFYTVHEGNVFFASEIKSLLAFGAPAHWDEEALMQEAFSLRPHERTLFKNIRTVPPGHYAIAQNGDVQTYRYWDLKFPLASDLAKDDRSDKEVVDGFREVLLDAVNQRLVADVEVASYLSGGIDSCAVLGLAQQGLSKPIRAYTLSFDDALYDESALAQKQAELIGSTYNQIPITQRDIADVYSDALWHNEALFSNGHAAAKFLLSRAVQDAGIKVVFTGEGADEMLAGYPPFRRDVLLYNSETQDPEVVKKLLADMYESNKATRGMLTTDAESPPEVDVVRRRLGFVPSWIEVFCQPGLQSRSLFSKELKANVGDMDPYELSLSRLPINEQLSGRDPLNQSLYLWTKHMLPNFILTSLSDRMEMAHSLEGRVPFLDHKVAEFAAAMPIRMKINGMREKHVLREAAKDVLIEEVYNREKHPFTSPPTQEGTDDALLELFNDTLTAKAIKEQPVFDPDAVEQLLETHRKTPPVDRIGMEMIIHRMVSTVILHQRFSMSA
jgi:asparagine synthase (glutamine-hydrolysing)